MRIPRTRPLSSLTLTILIATLPLTSCGLFAKVLGVPSDCERFTQDLDFATSEKIVRGTWRGTVTGLSTTQDTQTLELDLTASRVDASEYAFAGTFELEGEPPASIDGTVSGGCTERYRVITTADVDPAADPDLSTESLPPPASLEAEVRDAGGALLWRVAASGPSYGVALVDEGALAVGIASASDDDVQGEATLARVERP